MLKEACTDYRCVRMDEQQAILPFMTALFVDGLGPSRDRINPGVDWFREIPNAKEMIRIFRMPLPDVRQAERPEPVAGDAKQVQGEQPIYGIAAASSGNRQAAVRSMISGISHHFNNLLMGIWGNTTLIRMHLDAGDPLYARMLQMERLIQSSAFLIHMVLGYLGERRTVAKRIRLNQLIMEIKNEIQDCGGGEDDSWNFEARLKWASRVQRPRMIASSTARVLEVLFQGIGNHCRHIELEKADEAFISKKKATISTLVARGLAITHQLRLYAGDVKSRKVRIRMDALLDRLTARVQKNFPRVRVTFEKNTSLPLVKGDRRQIEHAVSELLSNAVAAMPEGGELAVSVGTLYPKALQRRCPDQFRREFVVVRIKDAGRGIVQKTQKRIFEPFYTDPLQHGKIGLGLAAVDGILATHNGYIQVQSSPGNGSVFSLYLPSAVSVEKRQQLPENQNVCAVA